MRIIVQNLAIEYEDRGTGPVMLFLHGWKDDLHTFDALAPTFVGSWRIILLDLPGFGKSELLPNAWGLTEYVLFVQVFLEKLKVSPAVIVGHSFGGRILIKGLAMNVFEVQKAVLVASAGVAKLKTTRSLFFGAVAKFGKLVTVIPPFYFWRNTLRKKLYSLIGSDYFQAGALKETFLKVVREDLSLDAKKIAIPVLLVWGSLDTETPLSDAQKFARLIQGATLQVYEGTGHFVHREKATEVAQRIKHFVE